MGSEIKLWREILAEQHIPYVALSFMGLRRRIRDTVNWDISASYPEYQEIFLDSGAYTLNREGSEYTREQAAELSGIYTEFVSRNIDRLSLVSEFDAHVLGYDYIQAMRKDFYDNLPPEKFMPVWHPSYGLQELDRLCSSYVVVGVAEMQAGDNSLLATLNSLVNRYGVRLHGIAMTGIKMMKQVKWDSAASMSWLSPSRYGDTIMWTASGELKRYPKAYKDQCRNQHRTYLEKQGFNVDKLLADDRREVLRLSLWSWGKFTDSMDKYSLISNSAAMEDISGIKGNMNSEVDTHDDSGRKNSEISVISGVRETSLFEAALGNYPVEVRSQDQVNALHSALIDLQAQRVLTLKKQEDAEMGYDFNVSAEIDRLNKLIRARHEMGKSGISVHIEASGPEGPGFMSSMFGASVGEKLAEKPVKASPQEIILEENSEIFEAELLNE
jgi:hypothetical protein